MADVISVQRRLSHDVSASPARSPWLAVRDQCPSAYDGALKVIKGRGIEAIAPQILERRGCAAGRTTMFRMRQGAVVLQMQCDLCDVAYELETIYNTS